jgi:hypothetical protein
MILSTLGASRQARSEADRLAYRDGAKFQSSFGRSMRMSAARPTTKHRRSFEASQPGGAQCLNSLEPLRINPGHRQEPATKPVLQLPVAPDQAAAPEIDGALARNAAPRILSATRINAQKSGSLVNAPLMRRSS